MSDKKPLGAVQKAKVESYHRQQDEALIEQLRTKMKQEAAADQIGQETGITDEVLLTQLAEQGITPETVPVLHLVPLLSVAWADGEIQSGERREILAAAKITGADTGPSRALLDEMLEQGPSKTLVDASLSFISHLMAAMPDGEASSQGGSLADMAWRIADASGGVFGMWGRVDAAEKKALRAIGEKLSAANPDAAAALLGRL
jgi:hypothetical protein